MRRQISALWSDHRIQSTLGDPSPFGKSRKKCICELQLITAIGQMAVIFEGFDMATPAGRPGCVHKMQETGSFNA
jgi:hypothetical protein